MAIIKPKGESIFVLPDKVIEKSGSIYLSDYSKRRPTTGTIVAIGEKIKDFIIGQRVVYGEFSGARETINDEEIFIMQPNDILALLE